MSFNRIVGLIGLFILIVSLAGCKSEPRPTATATPDIPPLEIANRAAEAMLNAETLHFTIERDGALVYVDADELLAFKRAEGDFVHPNGLRAVVRVITALTPVEFGMIALGDDQYLAEPITGRWGLLPPEWGEFNFAVLFDPQIGLQGMLRDGIIDLLLLGVENIQGQQHYHLSGRADGQKMEAMTLGLIGGGDVNLEVWVSADDFNVRRLYIVEPESDPEDPTTWDLKFSNWGAPVEIEAPPISKNEVIPGGIGEQKGLAGQFWRAF